jgi:hypothetical protein
MKRLKTLLSSAITLFAVDGCSAQGANLKNSFLEELQTLAEGVEVRLDWENPQPYPYAQSTDSAMWAWEFLRRNRPIKYSLPPELDARKNVLQNSKHW